MVIATSGKLGPKCKFADYVGYQRISIWLQFRDDFPAAKTRPRMSLNRAHIQWVVWRLGRSICRRPDGDHILAAIRACLSTVIPPAISQLMQFQSDIGVNGTITSAALNPRSRGSQAINPARVAANLIQEYASVGVSFTTQTLVIDRPKWRRCDGRLFFS